jgi:flavodoxin I
MLDPVPDPPLIRIVFASTSGHTQYVVDSLVRSLEQLSQRWRIAATRAEKTQPEDLRSGVLLVLASGTWNTGGSEGQLNPYMSMLLQDKASNLDLGGKPCACIGLGDDRYFYTARAVDLLQDYVIAHDGRLIVESLRVMNEPYGQEDKVQNWAKQLLEASQQIVRS